MRKIIIAAATTAAIALGMGAASAPANAQVFFGFGVGHPGYCGWHHCGPGWGPGWGPGYGFHRHGWRQDCHWVRVMRHHHWVTSPTFAPSLRTRWTN